MTQQVRLLFSFDKALAAAPFWTLSILWCAGFNLIDVFAWGAIGHILGYAALAIISLNTTGINPAPKF